MANETDFDHDQIGHILADKLLEVPQFQRAYSWKQDHVLEYLEDLRLARERGDAYFIGTVVFARPSVDSSRLQIVDGQQRLATTAVLYIAVRDLLRQLGKRELADETEKMFLRGFVLSAEANVERLVLSPKDLPTYNALLDEDLDSLDLRHPLYVCYSTCLEHLKALAPSPEDYAEIMGISAQLNDRVQVLVAIASGLAEAYVIFETLNDRGADLTTADLLKNYLFSKAGSYMRFFQESWISLEADFDKPDDLVRFIRHEYASRRGAVQVRRLYRAIQADLERPGANPRKYMEGLLAARVIYRALRNPDDQYWADQNSDVRDALLAYRRFGFESSFPTLLAAFAHLPKNSAAKLLVKISKWSVRAQFDGRIGGQQSEEAFGSAAVAITERVARTQPQVRQYLSKLIPTDAKFKAAFLAYGAVPVPRAKYLLAMLDRSRQASQGGSVNSVDWASTAYNIEHVYPNSAGRVDPAVADVVDSIGNLALLEKKLNRDLSDKPFLEKRSTYEQSAFQLTRELGDASSWGRDQIDRRLGQLAELAVTTWPVQ